ncbi:MAG TPA: hypothetical protein VI895_05005 [Bdellovibrionota bacterium]|nr:hypothetical protein [Bdellovibrionota bacterium]
MKRNRSKGDPDDTLIMRKPSDRRKRGRTEESGETEAAADHTVSDLANEFLGSLAEPGDRDPILDDRTRVGADTHLGKVYHPVLAGMLAFFVWGAGLLYVGHPIAASVVLLILISSFVLFTSLGGVAPLWLGDRFLQDVGWRFPLAESLAFVGCELVLLWWITIVVSASIAKNSLLEDFHPDSESIWPFFALPLPTLNFYLRGRFWRGHLFTLSLFVLLAAGIAVRKLWIAAPFLRLEEVGRQESFFMMVCTLAALGALGTALGFFGSFVGTFREMGWIRGAREGAESEIKFVLLGLLFIGGTFLYTLFGPPGAVIRHDGRNFANELARRGYVRSAEKIRSPLLVWERTNESVQDHLSLLK